MLLKLRNSRLNNKNKKTIKHKTATHTKFLLYYTAISTRAGIYFDIKKVLLIGHAFLENVPSCQVLSSPTMETAGGSLKAIQPPLNSSTLIALFHSA